ncbi:serine/threonine-protein kinase [Jatrophihabitans sp. DSM 45814]
MTVNVPGYRVGELLGYGSYGEVWAATKSQSGERFALKRVSVNAVSTVREVRAEAALLATLDHPNLIRLHEFVPCQDAFVLVMELAGGGSMADLLKRRARLTPAEVAASISPIAAALAYAHDEGVWHSDVSAANVLFTAAGHPKLADLGLARLLGSERGAISSTRAVLGTPAYVDPAVASGGPVGAASDVFSAAAVALHALTGFGPWQSAASVGVDEVLAVAAAGTLPDLATLLADCPPAMSAALIRALDLEPHRRGTAAELALDLRASVAPRSATPTVVLKAGRVAPRVGRHSVEIAKERLRQPSECKPAAVLSRGAGNDARPPFNRPGFLENGIVPADLTHVVRAQVRQPLTELRNDGRQFRWLRNHQRHIATGLLLTAVCGLVVGLMLTGAIGENDVGRHIDTAADKGVDVAADLRRLDAQRVLAFSRRQPDLLTAVYADPGLLAQDRNQLTQRVPLGCGLSGASTSYSSVVVTARSDRRIELRATASLASGMLSCGARPPVATRGLGPTPLSIVLTRPASGSFEITSLQVAR